MLVRALCSSWPEEEAKGGISGLVSHWGLYHLSNFPVELL